MTFKLFCFLWCLLLSGCIGTDEASFSSSSSSSSETEDAYANHCSSLVPQYNITTAPTNPHSLPSLSTRYFTASHSLLRPKPGRNYHSLQNNLTLRLQSNYSQTTAATVYNVQGLLTLRFPYSLANDAPFNFSNPERASLIQFPMYGFWSEKSRRLCMVGSTPWRDELRRAVLKLKFDEENPTVSTSVVSGSLESTSSAIDPAFFDAIAIFSFPELSNYDYSLVSESEEIGAVLPSREGESQRLLSLGATEFCSVLRFGMRNIELQYATECGELERRDCSPLENGDILLPSFLYLTSIQCSESEKKARFMANFQNHTNHGYDTFALGSTVIGESWWDDKNNMVMGVACPIMNASDAVGDCTMRLTLWYPSVHTVRNDAKIVGQIWSSKSVEDSGYFRKINAASSDQNGVVALRGQRYKYTEVDRARELCSTIKGPYKKGKVYPDWQSLDLKFDIKIKNREEEIMGWGYATPSWVGNELYRGSDMVVAFTPNKASINGNEFVANNHTKMSYKMWLHPLYNGKSSLGWVMNPYRGVEISVEGEYDAGNGYLCMVGCRKVVMNSTYTLSDCKIAMELEFPSLNEGRGDVIEGSIRSTRATTDPLYFDDLKLESAPRYVKPMDRFKWLVEFLTNC